VTTFYTIDTANARVPEVSDLLLRLRDDRHELVRLRDRLLELQNQAAAGSAPTTTGDRGPAGPVDASSRPTGRGGSVRSEPDVAGEDRRIQLRMQGVIDQMQALVTQIDGWGITLRDIDSGLIDFPALVMGRQIWLCWRLGEGPIDWWHELTAGVAGRRRLSDIA
jgi:hypothetical protein